MEVRHAAAPSAIRRATTEELRATYLVEDLFQSDRVSAVYTHHDRMILAGVRPEPDGPVAFETPPQLRATSFLDRREAGVINIGGPGSVLVANAEHALGRGDALYVGRGAGELTFASNEAEDPARFFIVSSPAHAAHPTALIRRDDVSPLSLGSAETSNGRTIRKYILPGEVASCQLVLGTTVLASGSTWNTMPSHTHDRRSEAYLYYDLDPEHRVIHLMGEPDQTRHLVVANEQAVISPSWSIHSGAGTSSYAFVWAMAGENQAFDDMDPVGIGNLR